MKLIMFAIFLVTYLEAKYSNLNSDLGSDYNAEPMDFFGKLFVYIFLLFIVSISYTGLEDGKNKDLVTSKKTLLLGYLLSSSLMLLAILNVFHIYIIIKIVTSIVFILTIISLHEKKISTNGILFILLSLLFLYNPLLQVYLYEKVLWDLANIGTMIIFIYSYYLLFIKKISLQPVNTEYIENIQEDDFDEQVERMSIAYIKYAKMNNKTNRAKDLKEYARYKLVGNTNLLYDGNGLSDKAIEKILIQTNHQTEKDSPVETKELEFDGTEKNNYAVKNDDLEWEYGIDSTSVTANETIHNKKGRD